MTEYVKLAHSERVYGETNLLQSQFSLLTVLKQYQVYELLRKEELLMKIELKKKIGELKEFLEILSKALPESKLIQEQEKKEEMKEEMIDKIEKAVQRSKKRTEKGWNEKKQKVQEAPEKPAKSSLQSELDAIRERLKHLEA